MRFLLKRWAVLKKIRPKSSVVRRLVSLGVLFFALTLVILQTGKHPFDQTSSVCRNSGSGDKKNIQVDVDCWGRELSQIIKNQGINAGLAFLTVHSANSLEFQVNCHNLAHHVGELAYQTVQKNNQLSVPSVHLCGNGFYHGFVGAVVKSGGNLSWAIKMCQTADQIKTPDQLDECLHGVGHGIVEDVEPYALDNPQTKITAALKACQDLGMGIDGQNSCDVGVYGWILSQSQNYFKVYVPPLELCLRQNDLQKGNCLHAAIRHITNLQKLYPELLTRSIVNLPDEKRAKILSWLAGSESGYELTKTSNLNDGFLFCRTLGADLALECFKGYVHAVKDISQSFTDASWAANVCGQPILKDEERQACPSIN